MSLEIVEFRSQKYGELAELPSHCEGKFAVGLGILGYVGKKEFCFNFFSDYCQRCIDNLDFRTEVRIFGKILLRFGDGSF